MWASIPGFRRRSCQCWQRSVQWVPGDVGACHPASHTGRTNTSQTAISSINQSTIGCLSSSQSQREDQHVTNCNNFNQPISNQFACHQLTNHQRVLRCSGYGLDSQLRRVRIQSPVASTSPRFTQPSIPPGSVERWTTAMLRVKWPPSDSWVYHDICCEI